MTTVVGELNEYDPSENESKPSTAFIDLATFDNIEKALYGGPKSITYFIRETVRSTWFTILPVKMQSDTVNPTFGQTFTVTVSRDGDYLMNSWIRLSLGAVSIYNPTNGWINTATEGRETITWTPNFMHNLIEKCTLKVNGQILDELYSEHLDFLSAFTVPKGSRIGYNRMIGNFCSPYGGMAGVNVSGYQAANYPNVNYQQELFLPLPFFFSKDTGLALPLVSLPYNTITMEFKLRDWRNLLSSIDVNGNITTVNVSQINQTTPVLYDVQTWGNYVVVTNKERQKVGCAQRDMIVETNQQLGGSYGSTLLSTTSATTTTSVNLRFDSSVKALFFAARNTSGSMSNPYRSNYSSQGPSASDITVCRIQASGAPDSFLDSSTEVNKGGGYSSGATDVDVDGTDPRTYAVVGESLYQEDGTDIGTVTALPSDVLITFGGGTLVSLDNNENFYFKNVFRMGNSSTTNAIGPTNIQINPFNENNNDKSGLIWKSFPQDPFRTIKLLYENSLRFNMEPLYYSLIQPHQHARNVPESSAMNNIYSLQNPSEVSGQPALSIGYHLYSYALKLKNTNPNGSTNYGDLRNASLVFTPSSDIQNSSQGPWRIFISALTQNVIRIKSGGMTYPIF